MAEKESMSIDRLYSLLLLFFFTIFSFWPIFDDEQAQQIATMIWRTQLACDKPAPLCMYVCMYLCVCQCVIIIFYLFPLKSHHQHTPTTTTKREEVFLSKILFFLFDSVCSGEILCDLQNHNTGNSANENRFWVCENDKIERQLFRRCTQKDWSRLWKKGSI